MSDSGPSSSYGVPYDTWVPAVAKRRRSGLAGRTPYEEVEETIPVHVRGATAVAALANVHALAELLDQVDRWWNGERVDAVKLRIKATNSTLTNPLEATLYPGERPLLSLSARLNDHDNKEIPGVELNVKRLGLWLGDEESDGPTTGTANPSIHTFTFSNDAELPSPVKLDVSLSGATLPDPSYLFVVENSTDLEINEGSNATQGSGWSTPTDTTNHALNSTILRLTGGSTTWGGHYFQKVISMDGRDLFVLLAVRQNDLSKTYQLKLESIQTNSTNGTFTKAVTVDNSTSNPQLIALGPITAPMYDYSFVNSHNIIRIHVLVDDATGSPTIDFDYYVCMIMDGDCNHVVKLQGKGDLTQTTVVYDHNLLSRKLPVVRDENNYIAYSHVSPPMLFSRGTNMNAAFVSTNGAHWRLTHSGTVQTPSMTAYRREAFLTPQ